MKKLIGKLLCWLGLHDMDESYCQRDGCDYHQIND